MNTDRQMKQSKENTIAQYKILHKHKAIIFPALYNSNVKDLISNIPVMSTITSELKSCIKR